MAREATPFQDVAKVPRSPAEAPVDGRVQAVIDNLISEEGAGRGELFDHAPSAITYAALELVAMHNAAEGHAEPIRADRQRRYRTKQLMGQRGLPTEDWFAIALEGEIGLAVAIAGLRVRAAAVGMELVPLVDRAPSVRSALCELLAQMGRLNTEGAGALKDDTVDADERARIRRLLPELKALTAQLEAADVAAGGL